MGVVNLDFGIWNLNCWIFEGIVEKCLECRMRFMFGVVFVVIWKIVGRMVGNLSIVY